MFVNDQVSPCDLATPVQCCISHWLGTCARSCATCFITKKNMNHTNFVKPEKARLDTLQRGHLLRLRYPLYRPNLSHDNNISSSTVCQSNDSRSYRVKLISMPCNNVKSTPVFAYHPNLFVQPFCA